MNDVLASTSFVPSVVAAPLTLTVPRALCPLIVTLLPVITPTALPFLIIN